MFESTAELQEKIRLNEDSLLELKEVRFSELRVAAPKRDDIARELTAFANSRGGVLVLGVEDGTREVQALSVEELDAMEKIVREICLDSIKPPLMGVKLEKVALPRGDGLKGAVLRVDVEAGVFVHKAPGGYYYRVGSSAREIEPSFLARLFQERSLTQTIRFEELPVPGTGMEALNEKLWKRFVTRREVDAVEALLKRNLLAKNEEGKLRASVLGVLMCSEDPRRYLPNAYIQAVRYRGVKQDSNFQVDAKDLSGPLDEQIANAMAFFRLNQRVGAHKRLGREEYVPFSERAVFEAVVNAVAHRDYSVDHSRIRFFMFDDRLEIYSPGGLVNSMGVDSMRLRTATRNERITNLLAECPVGEWADGLGRMHLMERRGDGVDIIIDESEALSGKLPEYRLLDDAELMLTIYAARFSNDEGKEDLI